MKIMVAACLGECLSLLRTRTTSGGKKTYKHRTVVSILLSKDQRFQSKQILECESTDGEKPTLKSYRHMAQLP